MITLESLKKKRVGIFPLKFDFAIEERKRYWQRVATMCAVFMVVVLLASGFAHAGFDEQLEDAVVRGDWAAVKELAFQNKQPQVALESIAFGYASLFTEDYEGAMMAFGQASGAVKRDITSSVNAAEEIIRHNPHCWTGYLLKADALARGGRYEEALDAANRAIKLNRNEAVVYHVRGLIHTLAGRESSALEDLNRAIEINKKLADAYVARGILRLRKDNPSEAQRDFEEALKLAPHFAMAANARGVALCQQERYEEGLQAFVFALDLQPNFTAAAENVEAAKILSTPGRMRTRIAIVAGRRAGALGRRTIAVVAAEKERADEATAAVAITLQGVTGLKPLVTADSNEATQELENGSRPVVLNVTLPKTQAPDVRVLDALKQISQKVPDVDVRVITDGPTAAQATAKALEQYVLAPGRVQQVKSFDMVDFSGTTQGAANVRELARTALRLRSMGVEVRAYERSDGAVVGNWTALTPAEKAGLPLVLVPSFNYSSTQPETKGFIGQLVPQIAASWASPPQQNELAIPKPAFCSTPSGEIGLFLPNLSHPDFGPGGPRVQTEHGLWVGASRNNNPQFLVVGQDGDILIRLDIGKPHGQTKSHINIQVGDTNIHTDKDGVELKKDDNVVVLVGGGKVIIEVNGEKVKDYDVPEADNDEEIIIERKPDGTTTATKGGKLVGKVEEKEDGTIIIRVGDKVIEVPPPPQPTNEGKGEKPTPEGEKRQGDAEKQENKYNSGIHPMVIIGGSGGMIILPGPLDGPGPINKPPHGSIDDVPPGWIVVPGPDGPTIIPDPRKPITYRSEDKRDGVYMVDDTNLEIVSAQKAGTGLLFGEHNDNVKNADALLQCPFLIFQVRSVEGGVKR